MKEQSSESGALAITNKNGKRVEHRVDSNSFELLMQELRGGEANSVEDGAVGLRCGGCGDTE